MDNLIKETESKTKTKTKTKNKTKKIKKHNVEFVLVNDTLNSNLKIIDAVNCKEISDKGKCELRTDCLLNKSNKCQKKSIKINNKPINEVREEEEEEEEQEQEEPLLLKDLIEEQRTKNIESRQFEFNEPEVVASRLTSSACDNIQILRDMLNKTRKNYDDKIKECEEEMFGEFIQKYFNKSEDKLSHKDLLTGLQKFYIDEKEKDVHFVLSMQDFIQRFSQKTSVLGTNYKRQHIFEALCRLLLFFNYDKGDLGNNKQFYKSVETFIKGDKDKINDIILSMKINEGSGAGKVDIFFKSKNTTKNDELWGCESITNINNEDNTLEEEKVHDEYILIQNKYYDKEKSNISNYDVTEIYALAERNKKQFSETIKIILMVNNGDALSNNLQKAKQQYPGLIDGLYGVVSLNAWFKVMLYDLLQSKNFSKFIDNVKGKEKEKPLLNLRFHQQYIIKCTNKCINERGISKFIWGAVPRSGKSYMIGGLISERQKNGNNNNIVIILGALTETLGQFKKMFEKLADFTNYNIITPDTREKEGNLNIYLFSQEWLKDKVIFTKNNKEIVASESLFNEKIKEKYPKMLKNGKQIDLYFDEIHKGGSTVTSESIIHAFDNSNVKIELFIMVTATFAKPTLRYTNLNFVGTGSQETEIIEWSYSDQQNMKYLTNETKKNMMINTRHGIQQEVLSDIFNYYEAFYGLEYLNALSREYIKYPELVLISPQSINIQSRSADFVPITDDVRNVFIDNLKCSACEPNKQIDFYRNPENIFENVEPVDNLLNNIYAIYNYFQTTLNYPITKLHTELWFLPDKDLYKEECTECKPEILDENMDEEHEKKYSIANIEPLSRGLAIQICKHTGFDRYNILIVHNTKLTYLGSKINNELFDIFVSNKGEKRIQMFDKKKGVGLSDQIKDFEIESYKEGKSLIILTGAKLRLGISLPCADIAFNFDNITSIDNNYQTMFRVLTEREKPQLKKYGYYIDFNKGRSIQFIYEYNKIYGEAKKLQSKEALQALQSLLFTFNYNGLNLIKSDTITELGLYNKLITGLELNEEGYMNFWTQRNNIVGLIKKTLANSSDTRFLKELTKVMKITKTQNNKKNEKHKLKEGTARETIPTVDRQEVENDNDNENVSDVEIENENQEEKEDYGDLISNVAEMLPSIIVLLAMFSNDITKTNNSCEDIKQCLEISLRNIKMFEKHCSCDNINDANILDCFLNSPGLINGEYQYDKNKLEFFIQIIINELDKNEDLYINLNFIFDNIRTLMRNSDGLIHDMTDKDIETKIEQYLSVREEEKNKHGEVFTPPTLIEEMLDKLPKPVWSNPDLKWLDPANGIGNFPMVAYQKLMKGLNSWEPNAKTRSKHIIEKMLYMVEINPKNVKISKKIFGSNANICCADFLKDSEKCFRQFGVDKFDIIIGNPPFQIEQQGKRIGGYGGRTLWDKFIIKSLDLLVSNGYLCFITPPGWRKPESELYSLMTNQNQLIYLHIFGERQGQQLFDVSQRIDLYIIQKKPIYKDTEIIDELGDKIELDLSKWAFLPNYDYNTISKILTTEENGIKIIYSSSIYETRKPYVKESKSERFKYPIVHSINQDGLVFWYTDDKTKGHFGVSKVLLNFNRHQYPVNDYNGKYGMSQITFGIPITSKKQGDDIVKAMNTDAFKEIIKATKWGAFQTDWRMFKYFKPDFYKYFLKGENATKIQSLSRGHQQRKKTKKLKESVLKIQSLTRGHQQRKKTQVLKSNQKGGKRKTRKYKKRTFFNLW